MTVSEMLSRLMYDDLGEGDDFVRSARELVSPDLVVRVNGRVFRDAAYLEHLREVRSTVHGGRMETTEEFVSGTRTAGRYLFHVSSPSGELVFESHIVSEVDPDGRLVRMAEVTRQAEATDDSDPARPAS